MVTRSPSSLSTFGKAKRDLALGLKRSPLFSWRYDNRDVSQLLLVPRDLRTADPSLSIELDMGQFGLAGATVLLDGGSPFQVTPPNLAWEKELHGFGWLRNLRAARTERALSQSIDLTEEWLETYKSLKGLPYEPDVAARRLISWFSYSNFLLHEADEQRYVRLLQSIDDHMRHLSMTSPHAADGMPRLLPLIALVYAGLCVANQESFAQAQIKALCAELDRQILPDGGHISRDNSVLASILLDLLPLKQCFVTLNQTPPKQLVAAINRMLPMIHYMRLGDGLMSRFNGAGTTLPDTLSTAMAYDDVSNAPLVAAPYSKYFRLERGNVVVIMDGGKPPALSLSGKAHAGCLSFEMSSGTCPMIVNCGAAPPAFSKMATNARATVAHSTLTINNRSSATFIHDPKTKTSELPSLLEGPATVQGHFDHDSDAYKIVGSHDGYLDRFGLVHHRLISISKDGYIVTGEDWIEAPQGVKQVEAGLGWPYAAHFHIHPDVLTTRASDGKSLTLTLPDSQSWKFYAGGALIYLEESTFYADFAGPCQAVQAVIRGNCLGPTSIPWKLTKVLADIPQTPRKLPSWLADNVISLESAAEEAREEDAGVPAVEGLDKADEQDEAGPETEKSAQDDGEAARPSDDEPGDEKGDEALTQPPPPPMLGKGEGLPARKKDVPASGKPLPLRDDAGAKGKAADEKKPNEGRGASKSEAKGEPKNKLTIKSEPQKAKRAKDERSEPAKLNKKKAADAMEMTKSTEAKADKDKSVADQSGMSAEKGEQSGWKAAPFEGSSARFETPSNRPKARPIEEATRILKPRAKSDEVEPEPSDVKNDQRQEAGENSAERTSEDASKDRSNNTYKDWAPNAGGEKTGKGRHDESGDQAPPSSAARKRVAGSSLIEKLERAAKEAEEIARRNAEAAAGRDAGDDRGTTAKSGKRADRKTSDDTDQGG